MKKTFLILRMMGVLLLFAAGGIAICRHVEDSLAGQRASRILAQMQAGVSTSPGMTDSAPATQPVRASIRGSGSDDAMAAPVQTDPAQPESECDTIGILTISSLKLELPILRGCSDELLAMSVCRYLGEAQDRPKRLVVAGHNYKRHFGSLPKLAAGDEILFTNSTGMIYHYRVTDLIEIAGNDRRALEQGEWDMTLFTCNSDGSGRILVRCREMC